MRRTRRLTTGEKWELGLVLSFLLVTFLCITAILNINGMPRLFAMAFHTTSNTPAEDMTSSNAVPAPAVAAPSFDVAAPALPSIPTPQITLIPPSVDPATPPAMTPKILHKKPAADVRIFGGEKYRFVKTLRLRVTAYSPDSHCCWPYPGTTTASGLSVKTNHGKLVAADTRLIPMHALVSVPGYANGSAVPVLDRGGAIKGYRMDVLMPKFDEAKEWGTRVLEVKVYMPVDE